MESSMLQKAVMLAETIMKEHPHIITEGWSYDAGVALTGFRALSEATEDAKYKEYADRYFSK